MSTKLLGLMFIVCLVSLIACEPEPAAGIKNRAPVARLRIAPTVQDSTRIFALDGRSSSDSADLYQLLLFRWDLDGDGQWDTDFGSQDYHLRYFIRPGIHTVRLEVKDRFGLSDSTSATLETYGIIQDTGSFTDIRDGQSYKMVKLAGDWWMAENLNYGIMIRDTQLARDNGIPEKYCYQDNPDNQSDKGGYTTYYDWNEAIGYDTLSPNGLCPPGWKMPMVADWNNLLNEYARRGYKTFFASGGFSRLNLTCIGFHELTKTWETIDTSPCSSFWMYLSGEFQKDFYQRGYKPCPWIVSSAYIGRANRGNIALMRFVSDSVGKNGAALPVRCIKIKEPSL